MSKFLISVLLASAAVSPAMAGPRDGDSRESREDRQEARQERQAARQQAREERAAERQSIQPQAEQRFQRQQQQQAFDASQFNRPNNVERSAEAGGVRARAGGRGSFARVQSDAAENFRQPSDQRQQLRDRGDLRQSSRPLPNVMQSRNPLIVSEVPRPGTQPPERTFRQRATRPVQWATNWRNDGRYDWRDHRRRHQSLFRVGVYFDPFGWSYRPYQIGWRLWPNYYSSRYWINDPWMYRLPYAPAGYRWIRYWNDALLVDTWTGEVVDVIPGFFW